MTDLYKWRTTKKIGLLVSEDYLLSKKADIFHLIGTKAIENYSCTQFSDVQLLKDSIAATPEDTWLKEALGKLDHNLQEKEKNFSDYICEDFTPEQKDRMVELVKKEREEIAEDKKDFEELKAEIEQAHKQSKEKSDKEITQSFKQFFKQSIKPEQEPQKTQSQEEPIRPVSFKELLKMQAPDIKYYADSMIPLTGITIIAGKRATFKTNFAINLGLSIASGKPFLGKFQTKKAPVLYIDEENGFILLQNRVIQTANATETTEADIHFTSLAGTNSRKFEELIQKLGVKVVIVDCWRRVTGCDENDAGEVAVFFSGIKRLISDYETSWIFLHHLRKDPNIKVSDPDPMDSLRGSGEMANAADMIFILKRKGSGNLVTMYQAKNRYAPELIPQVISVEWKDEKLNMNLLGDAEDALLAEQQAAKTLINLMVEEEKTRLTTAEAIKLLQRKEIGEATANRALKLLTDEGKLSKIKRGIYELVLGSLKDFGGKK